jgi:hypothetical protein
MMLRMRATLSMPAPSVMVGGSSARIQRFPPPAWAGTRCRAAEHAADREKAETDDRRDLVAAHSKRQQDVVGLTDLPHQDGFHLLDPFRQQDRGQHRRHGEGRDHRADQGVGIGARHRAENLTFHALHGEQRQEGGDSDDDRKENRLVDSMAALRMRRSLSVSRSSGPPSRRLIG